MNKVLVCSDRREDARVLFDLIRAHFPGVSVEHSDCQADCKADCTKEIRSAAQKNAGLPSVPDSARFQTHTEGEKDKGSAEDRAFLEVKRCPDRMTFQAVFYCRGKTGCANVSLSPEQFKEEAANREKRLLRLAVYKAVTDCFAVSSTWPTGNKQAQPDDDGCYAGPSPWGVLTGVRPVKIVHRLRAQGFDEERILRHLCRDFAIRQDKARLAVEVALNQRPYFLKPQEAGKTVSLYIGIPFCPTRCHYCSFPSYSLERMGRYLEDYLRGLQKELRAAGEFLRQHEIGVQNVYFGGGTPTILSPSQLDALLAQVSEEFPLTSEPEITVEAGRPDTISRRKLMVMKKHGVIRVSINPQTMHIPTLSAIGRKHTIEDIARAYDLARELGFPVINMDLIIGLPGEDCSLLRDTLEKVLLFKAENITLHALAIKRAAYYRQHCIELPSFAEGQAMTDLAHMMLKENGYLPYYLYRQKDIAAHGENTGYALAGKACRYNIQMMEERQTILGFGVGAASKYIDFRDYSMDNSHNPKDLLVYLDRLDTIVTAKVDKLKAFVYNNSEK